MNIRVIALLLCASAAQCSGSGTSGATATEPTIVGSPLIAIPAVADENRPVLQFSSKVALQTIDRRSDPRSLGKRSKLKLATDPLFSVRFGLERTLRALGFVIADGSGVPVTANLRRFEILESNDPSHAQAYLALDVEVRDPLGATILTRAYEGSSEDVGSPEQKLGAALSDVLAQLSIDRELQTVLASF